MPGLFPLQRFDVVVEICDALFLSRGVPATHAPEDVAPDRHFSVAVCGEVDLTAEHSGHFHGRIFAAIFLRQRGKISGLDFERTGRRAIALGFFSMTWSAVAHEHFPAGGGGRW